MKYLLILALTFAIGCDDKDKPTQPTETTVTLPPSTTLPTETTLPPTTTTTVEVTTTTVPAVVCESAGATIDCYGDWISGCRYFKDKADLLAKAIADGFGHCLELDTPPGGPQNMINTWVGFGPCVSCLTMPGMMKRLNIFAAPAPAKNGMSESTIKALDKAYPPK